MNCEGPVPATQELKKMEEPLLERAVDVAVNLEGSGVAVLPDSHQPATAALLRSMNWRPDVLQKGIGTVMGVYVPCMVRCVCWAGCTQGRPRALWVVLIVRLLPRCVLHAHCMLRAGCLYTNGFARYSSAAAKGWVLCCRCRS
jgi:hypothetical protein